MPRGRFRKCSKSAANSIQKVPLTPPLWDPHRKKRKNQKNAAGVGLASPQLSHPPHPHSLNKVDFIPMPYGHQSAPNSVSPLGISAKRQGIADRMTRLRPPAPVILWGLGGRCRSSSATIIKQAPPAVQSSGTFGGRLKAGWCRLTGSVKLGSHATTPRRKGVNLIL